MQHLDFSRAPSALMPLCPGCTGPWRVAMDMAMHNEQPQLAFTMVRPMPGRLGQGPSPWRLGVAANALVQPGERRVVAAVCRTQRNLQMEAGLEAMEAELLPVADQPYLPKRFVRRSGAVVAWHLHSHDHGGRGRRTAMLPPGFTLGGTFRVWQSLGARPVLDSQLRLTLGTQAISASRRQQLWADVGWRGLVGSDDRLLAVGGWRMPKPVAAGHHVLKEGVLGYEDMVRYTARTVHAQLGAGAALGRHSRIDVFAAATQFDTLAHKPGRWLRSLGARVNMSPRGSRGFRPTVSYQLARRFDGSRGPWLHMLTASI